MNEWWVENQQSGRASIVLAYALGKAQRILSGINQTIGPIYVHGAVHHVNEVYRRAGIELPPSEPVYAAPKATDWSRAMIIAPPSAFRSPWMRRFGVSLCLRFGLDAGARRSAQARNRSGLHTL